MKIIYSNKKTQKLCEDYKVAIKTLGNQVADKLNDLLNAIDAFPNLFDLSALPQYRVHPLHGDRKYQYSMVISKGSKWRLIVYPLDKEEKLLTDNNNESLMLSKAVILEIEEVSEHYA